MGFDSAFGEGKSRWRNEPIGIRQTLSNMLRNVSAHLGSRDENWNQAVYRTVLRLHEHIGISPNDPRTTWRWMEYAPPENANHETNRSNGWHLAIVIASILIAFARRERWYALSVVGGFLLFCAYLKWQPFLARLFLPHYVLAMPLAGVCASAFANRCGAVTLPRGCRYSRIGSARCAVSRASSGFREIVNTSPT